jgi:glycosyltransferase involved in cell wall biosynthesis
MAGEVTPRLSAPFFSVIVPVYNRAHSLAPALRSVLDQSCQDFEIVVVDDGSKDDPKAVIDALGDPRIRYIRQDNRGGSAARNDAIDHARGTFIAPLDSDDVFLPHHLEAMQRLMTGTTNTVGYARMIVDRGDGRTMLKPPRAIRAGEHMATYLMCDRGFVPTITVVVDRETARRVRYDESLPFAQDMDFALRLYLGGCAFKMAEAPGAIWQDEYNPNRTSAGRKSARLRDWLEAMRPRIPAKAYYGAQGWMIAKGVAQTSKFAALKLFLDAVTRGCYRPKMAAVVFLQIFFPDWLYRRVADGVIALFRGAVWSRAERGVAAAE